MADVSRRDVGHVFFWEPTLIADLKFPLMIFELRDAFFLTEKMLKRMEDVQLKGRAAMVMLAYEL